MIDETLKLIGSGALVLGLVTATSACSTAVPTEGSGEMQELRDDGPGLAGELEERVAEQVRDDDAQLEGLELISEYENVSADTIRVQLDGEVSADQRETVASSLFTVATESGSPLATILMTDATGEESEHSR